VNTEKIRQKLSNGFRTLALQLSNGKRYVVPVPEFILVHRNVVAVLGKDDSATTIAGDVSRTGQLLESPFIERLDLGPMHTLNAS